MDHSRFTRSTTSAVVKPPQVVVRRAAAALPGRRHRRPGGLAAGAICRASASASPTRRSRPTSFAASARWIRSSGSARSRSCSSARPSSNASFAKRSSIRQSRSVRLPTALRSNLEKNIEVPNPIGLNGRPDPSRGVELFYLGYTDRDPPAGAAHRRPRGQRLRRGDLESADDTRRKHLGLLVQR